MAIACVMAALMCCPALAFADGVTVSAEKEAAVMDGSPFGLADFDRAQKGSNREIDDTYVGYSYFISSEEGRFAAIATDSYVVAYLPPNLAQASGIDLYRESDKLALQGMVMRLDNANASGGSELTSEMVWYFTEDNVFSKDGVEFRFDQQLKPGQYYACVVGADGSDVTESTGSGKVAVTHAVSAKVLPADQVGIKQAATGFDAVVEFLTTLDWSPLWITLKTTLTAIVFVFILGLAAAYFLLRLDSKVQGILDSIFTIPMVLPPTVCGFVLLYLCGSKTPFGQFFIDIGFPLIFSWPATVIAATIVAFPLMYRSARGAFEAIDSRMLDAARTLGWSNARIFFRLMLPLSWSSIAAGTVLAFARALGEFGATLFLAGNYLGITRTIPIAIYFEWMNGNDGIAWFWAGVIIAFSFVVILFINVWSNRTTRYRRGSEE